MDIKEHTTPEKLLHYSFIWSIARMLIAALALFMGGIPPAYLLLNVLPSFSNPISSLLNIAWIISGIAAAYLLYRWHTGGKIVFGGKKQADVIAFFVMVVSGFNLGFTGLSGQNIGISIFSSQIFLMIGGVIYLATVAYLLKRWKESGKRVL